MDEKKHIDRLFQEKLKDFEVFPDAQVWNNIEQQLVKKKKRRVFPLWLRLGGAAAAFLMLVSGGIWFFNSEKPIPNLPNTNSIITDVDTDEKENKLEENEQFPSTNEEQTNQTKDIIAAPTQKGTLQLKNKNTTRFANTSNQQQEETKTSTNTKKLISTVIKEKANNIAKAEVKKDDIKTIDANINKSIDAKKELVIASNTKENNVAKQEAKQDINKVLEENTTVALEEKDESKQRRWSVGSTVAPVYFNTLKEGSPIDASLANNSKSSDASISYGLKVNYKINKRLSLQSGINSVDLAYNTKDVTTLISSNQALASGTNLDTNVDGFNIVAFTSNNVAARSNELAAAPRSGFLNLNGDLNQSLSYIEIPMEAKYNLLQRKLGVNVVGGVSTYVLYKNNVTLQNEIGATTLGEASNINDVNFSGNLGLDFDYKISKKLYINVSPMFKYQFNTFSKNDGGFEPYYLGVYTGLNFRF